MVNKKYTSQRKTILRLSVMIMLLVMFAVTMTFAFFTASRNATSNTMTFGTLTVGVNGLAQEATVCHTPIVPGCTIGLKGKIELAQREDDAENGNITEQSNISAFMRIALTVSGYGGDVLPSSKNLTNAIAAAFENQGWLKKRENGNPAGIYLYYAGRFVPVDTANADLGTYDIKAFNLNTISFKISETLFGNEWQNKRFKLSIEAQAIQAEHLQYDNNGTLTNLTASDYADLSDNAKKIAFVNKLAGASQEGVSSNLNVWTAIFGEEPAEDEIEGLPITDLNISTNVSSNYNGLPPMSNLANNLLNGMKTLNNGVANPSRLLDASNSKVVKVGLNSTAFEGGALNVPQYVMYNYRDDTWNREVNAGEYASLYATQTGNEWQVVFKVVEIGFVSQSEVLVKPGNEPTPVVLDADVEKIMYDLISNGFNYQPYNGGGGEVMHAPPMTNLASNTNEISQAKLLSAVDDDDLIFENICYQDANQNIQFQSYSYITANYPKTWKAVVVMACLGISPNDLDFSYRAIEELYNSIILGLTDLNLPSYEDFVLSYELDRQQVIAQIMEKIEDEVYQTSKNWLLDLNDRGGCWNSTTTELVYDSQNDEYYMNYYVNAGNYLNILSLISAPNEEPEYGYIYASLSALKNADDANHTLYNSWKTFVQELYGFWDWQGPTTFNNYGEFVTYFEDVEDCAPATDASIYEIFVDFIDYINSDRPYIWGETHFNSSTGNMVYGIDVENNYTDILRMGQDGYEFIYATLAALQENDDANNTLLNEWKAFAQDAYGVNDCHGLTTFTNFNQFLEYYDYNNNYLLNPSYIFTSYVDDVIYLDFLDWFSAANNNGYWGVSGLESDTSVDPTEYWMEYYINPSEYTGVLDNSVDGLIYQDSFDWIDVINGAYIQTSGAVNLWEEDYYENNVKVFSSFDLTNPSNPYLNFVSYNATSHTVSYIYSSYTALQNASNVNISDWEQFVSRLASLDMPEAYDNYDVLKGQYSINYYPVYSTLAELKAADDNNNTLYNKWKALVQELCTFCNNINSPTTFNSYDDFVLYANSVTNGSTGTTDASIYEFFAEFIAEVNSNNSSLWGETRFDYGSGNMVYGIDVNSNYTDILQIGQDGYEYIYATLADLQAADDNSHTLLNKWKAFAQDLFGICDSQGKKNAFGNYNNFVKMYAYNNNYVEPDDFEKYMTLYDGGITDACDNVFAAFCEANGLLGNDNSAFGSSTTITSVVLPEGVTSIPDNAFSGCTNLTSVTLPSTVTSIGAYAFKDCTSLESFTIPSSVIELGFQMFDGCTALSTVVFEEGSTIEELGGIFAGLESIESITLPNLSAISYHDFYNCISLESIVIPASVQEIGDEAFYGCESLATITFEEGINIAYLDSAFSHCTGLESIIIPASVESVGYGTFYDCTSLRSVSFEQGCGLSSIGDSMFRKCTSLQSITLSNNITSIGSYAFDGCTSLTSIVIPTNISSLSYAIFQGCSSLSNVVLPTGLESISDYAFYGCTSLDNISFNGNLSSIGAYTFYGCGFETLTVPASITSIGSNAFSACNDLITVSFANNSTITNIGNAFNNCTSLQSINLPESLTTIANQAFMGCTSLESLTIPASVSSIGNQAFYNCTNLKRVNSSTDGKFYFGSNILTMGNNCLFGCKYIEDLTLPFIGLTAASYNNNSTGATVGILFYRDNYQYFDTNSFDRIYTNLSVDGNSNGNYNVSIVPKGLTKLTVLGGYIRSNGLGCLMTKLDTLVFDGDVRTSSSILSGGNDAIGNIRLTTLIFTEKVREIMSAFSYCTNLTNVTISNGVTYIGGQAFKNCSSLTSLYIPASVTSIHSAEGPFNHCGNLQSIVVDSANPNYTSRYNSQECNALMNKACTTLIRATNNSIIPDTITTIGAYAFSGCTGITNIGLPTGTTTISNGAFYDCINLTSVTIPSGVTSIERQAFRGCTNLAGITIPSGVTSIGSYTFEECINLAEVNFAENSQLTSIEGNAFYDCRSLTQLTIPSGLTSISGSAFSRCYALAEIYKPGSNLSDMTIGATTNGYISRYAKVIHTSLDTPSRIVTDNNVKYYIYDTVKIALSMVDKTQSTLTIANGCTLINERAFYENKYLTKVVIPNSVASIGDSAFMCCYSLAEVYNLSNLSISVFNSTNGYISYYAKAVYTDIGDQSNVVTENNVKYFVYGNQKTAIGVVDRTQSQITLANDCTGISQYVFDGMKSLTSITIPSTVTSIGNYAFQNCSELTSVTFAGNSTLTTIGMYAFFKCAKLCSIEIPSTVTSIGNYAFKQCEGLVNVTIADGNAAMVISNYVFSYCYNLASIVIPNRVTSIGQRAFERCISLASVTFGANSNLTTIGEYAFSSCIRLTSITIPSGVTSLGVGVFNSCGLTSVTFLNNLTSIPDAFFGGCAGLTSITIPNTVTSIGQSAFSLCSGLTSITIPSSVKTIGSYAFERCTGLTTITVPSSVTSLGNGAFSNCKGLTTAYLYLTSSSNKITNYRTYAWFYQCNNKLSLHARSSVRSAASTVFGQYWNYYQDSNSARLSTVYDL